MNQSKCVPFGPWVLKSFEERCRTFSGIYLAAQFSQNFDNFYPNIAYISFVFFY